MHEREDILRPTIREARPPFSPERERSPAAPLALPNPFGGPGGEATVIHSRLKQSWIDMQKRHDVPVGPLGLEIDPRDQMTLKLWRDEGIDRFLKK
jgi:hypothetical protein